MTRQEHYTEAERLTAEASNLSASRTAQADRLLRLAQIHATLAHVPVPAPAPAAPKPA